MCQMKCGPFVLSRNVIEKKRGECITKDTPLSQPTYMNSGEISSPLK